MHTALVGESSLRERELATFDCCVCSVWLMTLVVVVALLLRLAALEFVDEYTLYAVPVAVSVCAFAWVADFW